jgi:hypothetical protein
MVFDMAQTQLVITELLLGLGTNAGEASDILLDVLELLSRIVRGLARRGSCLGNRFAHSRVAR